METPKPSVGRIVQVNSGTAEQERWVPMIITEVHNATSVSGVVFDGRAGSDAAEAHSSCVEGPQVGQWRWPPRV